MSSSKNLGTHQLNKSLLLSGNQALARGAIEAGVALVTGYPGTPSTYAIEALLATPDLNFRVEWSINEKVAFEVATGVSWAGLRSLVTMKMSGLNVASDAFVSVQYSGTNGGLVVYVADDPNTYYGMVEQDSRHYARLAAAPMLTPADPQEALNFTRRAFDLSEKTGRPVMILMTTALANTSELVTLGKIKSIKREPSFDFNIARYSKAGPAACVKQHRDTLAGLKNFGSLTDDLNPLFLTESRTGVIAAGITWNYLQEVIHSNRLNPCRLKLGVANPLPKEKIKSLLSKIDTVVILEELEPLVEEAVLALRSDIDHPVKVIGKTNGYLPLTGDYDVNTVYSVFDDLYRDNNMSSAPVSDDLIEKAQALKVKRLNTFCSGCPHRATYYALNRAIEKLGYKKRDVIVTGDIGCTILGMNEPFQSCWTEVCMGSSISIAQGFKYAGIKNPVVATIGDGTFFHAGIPAFLNASHNKTNLTVIILDNHWTAMTGMQPHVGTRETVSDEEKRIIVPEEIVKAAGIENIWRVNPYQIKKMVPILMKALSSPDVSVVISDAECTIQMARRRKTGSLKVDQEKCVGLDKCEYSCMEVLGCPAIERGEEGKAFINPDECTACGLCHHVCPYGAI